jgi:hypothetical protein
MAEGPRKIVRRAFPRPRDEEEFAGSPYIHVESKIAVG